MINRRKFLKNSSIFGIAPFLPNYNIIDSNGNINDANPSLPRYKKFGNMIDIRKSDYPVKTCNNKSHILNIYQVLHTFVKEISFGNWWQTISSVTGPVNVLYLTDNINTTSTGITDSNQNIYVPNALLPKNGYVIYYYMF